MPLLPHMSALSPNIYYDAATMRYYHHANANITDAAHHKARVHAEYECQSTCSSSLRDEALVAGDKA